MFMAHPLRALSRPLRRKVGPGFLLWKEKSFFFFIVQKMSPGIGAWGYVAIILSVVLSGMGVYYFILFYPIVCKRERMYDVMEMTAV